MDQQHPFPVSTSDIVPPGNTDVPVDELHTIPINEGQIESPGMNLSQYKPLQEAAARGDWYMAKRIFEKNKEFLTAVISQEGMTVLHVAAKNGHSRLVTKLVGKISPESMDIRDNFGRTALHYVALVGTVREARAMLRKNQDLAKIADKQKYTPLFVAAQWGRRDMVWYLAKAANYEPLIGPLASRFILGITRFGFCDISLYFLKRHQNLALAINDKRETILHFIAKDPSLFPSGTRLHFLDRILYTIVPVAFFHEHGQLSDSIQSSSNLNKGIFLKFLGWLVPHISNVHTVKLRHKHSKELAELVFERFKAVIASNEAILYPFLSDVMHLAIANGIIELVHECLESFPELLWYVYKERLFLHVAIENRQEKIFNYLIEIAGERKNSFVNVISEEKNNLLHLAAKLAPPSRLYSISGSALQMQLEMQWFKEVEKLVGENFKFERNGDNHTPQELFREQHEQLQKNGEEWMKGTSNSCMIVATLIATVVFASMITVPGGTTGDTGIPIFLPATSFAIFSISNALALLLSLSSVLLFLAILTSSYGQEDFLKSLPKKLMGGLALLLFSIAAVMIAFAHALQIALISRFRWVFTVSYLFVGIPVGLFAVLQLSLFIQIFQSTLSPGIFRRLSLVSRRISNRPILEFETKH